VHQIDGRASVSPTPLSSRGITASEFTYASAGPGTVVQMGKDLCEAAADGNLMMLMTLVQQGAMVDAADYDR
jgi:hypothetical protein